MHLRNLLQGVHQSQDLWEVFRRVLGQHMAEVPLRDIGLGLDLTSQDTPADRTVCYHGNAQLSAGLQDFGGWRLNVQCKRAVLHLERGDRVDSVCSTYSCSGDFREPEVPDLALTIYIQDKFVRGKGKLVGRWKVGEEDLLLQVHHRFDRLLDRGHSIRPVAVI